MPSNYFECCSRVNPMDSVPEALSNIVKNDKKQDIEIAKKVNEYDLSNVAKSGRYGDLIDKPVALPNPKPITINGQRYDGSEAVEVNVAAGGGGATVELDTTLTQSGKAADAKAVGDRLSALNEANAAQDTEIAKKANDAELAKVAKSGSYNDLSNKPTIPTVPTTLPNPNALTFTGAVNETYDGSAAKSVAIPSVPESLKNPNKLTFTGAVTAEYDGSAPVSVEIPAGGSGSYTLPIASPTTLGGVMPVAKTDEMTHAVGVDDAGGLWTMAGAGGGENIAALPVSNNIIASGTIPSGVAAKEDGYVDTGLTLGDLKKYKYFGFFMRTDASVYTSFVIGTQKINYSTVNGYGMVYHWVDDAKTLAVSETNGTGNSNRWGSYTTVSIVNYYSGTNAFPFYTTAPDDTKIYAGITNMNGITNTQKDIIWSIQAYAEYKG